MCRCDPTRGQTCRRCADGIEAAEQERELSDTTFDDGRDADFEAARVFGGAW